MMNTTKVKTFVEKSIVETMNKNMEWSLVGKGYRSQYLDRGENYERIKEVYINKNKHGDIAAIGRYDRRKYHNENEYYFEDVYFITFTDGKFESIITFSEGNNLGISFQVELGKLYRFVQMEVSGLSDKLNSWFDD